MDGNVDEADEVTVEVAVLDIEVDAGEVAEVEADVDAGVEAELDADVDAEVEADDEIDEVAVDVCAVDGDVTSQPKVPALIVYHPLPTSNLSARTIGPPPGMGRE